MKRHHEEDDNPAGTTSISFSFLFFGGSYLILKVILKFKKKTMGIAPLVL